jgi:hypothetical protein
MAAHVQQSLNPRDSVVLVRGGMQGGNAYPLEPPPARFMAPEALLAHAAAVKRVYPDDFQQPRD